MQHMSLAGKTIFITGAATGIGRATALAFAKEGVNVVGFDFNGPELARTISMVENGGGKALAIEGDVRDEQAVARGFEKGVGTFGRIELAHNNAGIIDDHRPLTETSLDQFRAIMETNVFGVVNSLKAEMPHMAEIGGGAIVNTASASGLTALPGIASYITSKHAVVGLTRAAALEGAPKKIRINAICPAFVETPLTEGLFRTDPTAREAIIAAHPAGWICQPENIADTVVYLCSDKSAYLYGAMISIDGGFTVM